PRLHDDLAALDVLALGAAEEKTAVLAGPCLVELLVEHLDTSDRGLLRRADADDLDLGVDRESATLGAAGDDGSTTGDREDVLDGHEERLVAVTLGVRNAVVDSFHELCDRVDPLLFALERLQRRDLDNGCVFVEALASEELANLELDELKDLFVVNH